jgi:hypothetical protein
MTDHRPSLPIRLLSAFARAVLTLLVLIDEIARPLYRPLTRWISSLALIARMEAAIARLPRLAILLLLAIPFAIAEPAKLGSLFLIADGRMKSGLIMLGLAHLFSFIVVERIYHAGREKLLTYGWLNWTMTLLASLRDRALAWIRSSAIYRSVIALRDDVRQWWRRHSPGDRGPR